jgi:hypothetical protein
MREIRRAIATVGLLSLALLPVMAAVPTDRAKKASLDSLPSSHMPVAIARPLGTIERPLAVRPSTRFGTKPMLPESGMLVLVGSALLGLASIVRKTTG